MAEQTDVRYDQLTSLVQWGKLQTPPRRDAVLITSGPYRGRIGTIKTARGCFPNVIATVTL